ncbi:MAG: glucose-6-phosphate isomerase, partial [Alphaproteobacteria bacterium]
MSSARINDLWRRLAAEGKKAKQRNIPALFEADPERFCRMALEAAGICLDTSKTTLTDETLGLLHELARAAALEEARDALFAGRHVNATEDRPALHTALRDSSTAPLVVEGRNVREDIASVRERMRAFSERFRAGAMRGADGRPLRRILALGIGGSDLGPRLVVRALTPPGEESPIRFAANVDGAEILEALGPLDPRETLVIVASKSMGTQETMKNAATARAWMEAGAGQGAWAAQTVAVTARPDRARELAIEEAQIFPFWDWVGGRYSVWSAIGLPVALALGWEAFDALCRGAHEMDRHFRETPLERNLPVRLGLTGIWHCSVRGYGALAVIPYAAGLDLLPAYLQQLEMESNGKSVTLDGTHVLAPTAPVIWGGAGTNGQHAFFQQLHQGTGVIPADFIGVARPPADSGGHHRLLMANMLAQTEALARGRSREQTERALTARGLSAEEVARLAPHCTFPGNRPTVTLLLDRLEPGPLGALIALYEHKVFAQSVIWGINAFDQWGVELGKEL